MCLQAALTIMFIIIGGGFRSLINFAVVGAYRPLASSEAVLTAAFFACENSVLGILFPYCMRPDLRLIGSGLTAGMQVLGLVILRIKEPLLERCVPRPLYECKTLSLTYLVNQAVQDVDRDSFDILRCASALCFAGKRFLIWL